MILWSWPMECGGQADVESRPRSECVVCVFQPPPPPLVPEFDCTVHIVLDCFGKAGCAYRETDEEETGASAVIDNLFTGQFNNPLRVIAFNTAEGWSRDVSEDIVWELLK